jgi:NAD(P) transhydrogenase subunit alpha
VLDFLKLIVDKDGKLVIDREDEIVRATLLCADGEAAAQIIGRVTWKSATPSST